jgi:hypothetical protein
MGDDGTARPGAGAFILLLQSYVFAIRSERAHAANKECSGIQFQPVIVARPAPALRTQRRSTARKLKLPAWAGCAFCGLSPGCNEAILFRGGVSSRRRGFMRKLRKTAAATMLVLGTMAMMASAQAQWQGAAKLHAPLQNATPIITQVACNGHTGACGCGRGWVSACRDRCCRCVPC